MSGSIELNDYENDHDHEWIVESDCDQVRILSERFDTEPGFDHVTINGEVYSGSDAIDQVVDQSDFSVMFLSDGSVTGTGFVLLWSCYAQIQGKLSF